MWKLTEIYAQNICAFRQLHYYPKQGATTLVSGDNRDNEAQRSNGSGKSALIECIATGITGSPLRKVRNEELINDNSDECLIELTFSNEPLREKFIIERKLYRTGNASVACYIHRNGEAEAEEAVQPGNEACNKFILDKLGLSRDELLSSFILSKHRYRDFLSCPDRDKKEIINRFSNGDMVDRAIHEIIKDKAPLAGLLRQAELEYAGIEGRKAILAGQIREEEENAAAAGKSKEERMARISATISGKRDLIRIKSGYLKELEAGKAEIEEADNRVQQLEKAGCSLEEHLSGINSYLSLISAGAPSDWDSIIRGKKKQLAEAEAELSACNKDLEASEKEYREISERHRRLKEDFDHFVKESAGRAETYGGELSRLDDRHSAVLKELEALKKTRAGLTASFESLAGKLAGVIGCPACGHEFTISDKDFDVARGRQDRDEIGGNLQAVATRIENRDAALQDIENEQYAVGKKSRSLKAEHIMRSEKLLLAGRDVTAASHRAEQVKRAQARITGRINGLHTDTGGILRKIYDEAFGLVDEAYRTNERNRHAVCDEIRICESAVEALEGSLKELDETDGRMLLDSLARSLAEAEAGSMKLLSKKIKLEEEIGLLERQEQNFTAFKTYLANSKIEALATMTNGFLESTGSDIRVKLSGYTLLKSGKARDRISVSVIRSGIDCGSFGKFSAGESARVNLATILAMQKLANANCGDDKGLDLLVLDEILEAVDEEGLSSMFNALNRMGITALVVSHGNIAESYPHTLKITKENGESRLCEAPPR